MAAVDINVPTKTNTLLPGAISVYILKTVVWTGEPVPLEHVQDSKKLDMEAYVELFEITLSDKSTKIYLKQDEDVVWQGVTYDGTGIEISGVATFADDETARPKVSIYNPDGVFSSLIDQGLLDNAIFKRTRILKSHFDAGVNISRSQRWKVNRISSVRKNLIAVELRDLLDGQFFQVPGRMFIPPEFPQVNLR